MRRSKKVTLEDFVKDSCYFYDKGNCSILVGREQEKGIPFPKRKCIPEPFCEKGKEIKEFMKKIKTEDPGIIEEPVILSRYLT